VLFETDDLHDVPSLTTPGLIEALQVMGLLGSNGPWRGRHSNRGGHATRIKGRSFYSFPLSTDSALGGLRGVGINAGMLDGGQPCLEAGHFAGACTMLHTQVQVALRR
ncbi:hypothetical protein, partial [Mycobacterium sp.]|uniref:hypothetical protein n=1 Tax=Mycobacterium sp. TaxID=1785 RepID=UPI003C72DC08